MVRVVVEYQELRWAARRWWDKADRNQRGALGRPAGDWAPENVFCKDWWELTGSEESLVVRYFSESGH